MTAQREPTCLNTTIFMVTPTPLTGVRWYSKGRHTGFAGADGATWRYAWRCMLRINSVTSRFGTNESLKQGTAWAISPKKPKPESMP